MDAHQLFKKLCSGVKFDKKRFQSDAERFQLVKKHPENSPWQNKDADANQEEILQEKPVKRKHEDDEKEIEDIETLTLLDGISVPASGKKAKTKKLKAAMTEGKKLKLEKEKVNQFRNQHRISVTGSHVPEPISTFDQLSSRYKVPDLLVNNIKSCGYTCPTPIQMQALPVMLQGRQVLACAPTGSGKTAAFLLPIIYHLGGPQRKGFRAIILSPTRELAKQTYRECIRLSEGCGFRIHIISKVNQALQKYGPKSSQKFDILITTPKRLVFLLNQDPPAISLNNVEWLIVDEADKLFEDGSRSFRDQLEEISKACTNENLRRAMFSATNTPVVTRWCRHNLKGLITVTVGHRNAATDLVDQELLFVGAERGKLVALRNIIRKGVMPPVLIFVQSKERAQELFNELIYDGINVDVIHADRTQTQRDNVVRCFREGKIWVLVCTELMARGIDFKGVNLVINYDFPPSAISYVHRIGRTGRAGHRGKAITFFTEDDTTNLRSIASIMRDSGCEIPGYMLAMKKHSKKERRKLERSAPARERISTMPKFKHNGPRKTTVKATTKPRNGPIDISEISEAELKQKLEEDEGEWEKENEASAKDELAKEKKKKIGKTLPGKKKLLKKAPLRVVKKGTMKKKKSTKKLQSSAKKKVTPVSKN